VPINPVIYGLNTSILRGWIEES